MTWVGESSRFVRLQDRLVRWEDIREVDLSQLARSGIVLVQTFDARPATELRGAEAIDFVMRVAPGFVEGKRFRWLRHGWALHNLIGHPLLQLLAWAGHTQAGLRLHDATIPRPR
jgi:hypothetical protein